MRAFVLLSLLLLPTLALADEHCRLQAPQQVDFELAGVHTVVFELGHHDMHLAGNDTAGNVEVRGRGCASSEELLKTLHVSQRRDGDRLIIKAEGADDMRFGWFGDHYAWLDLKVRLPANVAVEVDTGSGDAWVEKVASLKASVGSGDLDVREVAGAFTATIGSGDLAVDGVGRFDLEAVGSGDVKARTVRGDASVGSVGSGDVSLADVAGKVEVGNVGSGDFTLRRVKGDASFSAVASGDIDVDGIGGNFSVGAVASGDVSYRNVKGKVSVPSRD